MFTAGVSQAMVLSNVQSKLTNLRSAIAGIKELEDWAAGVVAADLTALGFSPTDAPVLLSAITEAMTTVTTYNANASFQRQVMGPQ